jgi:branched-chain amino acid transport system ATP-binding protein
MADVAALSFEHVIAGYGETVVLDDVSLSLGAGDTLALLGRNGVATRRCTAVASASPAAT